MMATIFGRVQSKLVRLIIRIYRAVSKRLRILLWKNRFRHMGRDCFIGPYNVFELPETISFGDRVATAAFVHIWGGADVQIGDDTLIAAKVCISSLSHDVNALSKQKTYRSTITKNPVKIGRNCWLGTGAIILDGVTIGDNVIVAAGSVVRSDVPSDCVVAGVPARIIRNLLADQQHQMIVNT